MEAISLFAVTYLVLVPAIVYWVYDKKKGLYPLASLYLCLGINATVKLTACIYRPWIRDLRVIPAGDAIRMVTGYSFPSGHTATAGPIYGGLAKVFYPIRKWIAYLLIMLLLITGFSRNYICDGQDIQIRRKCILPCRHLSGTDQAILSADRKLNQKTSSGVSA